MRTNGFRYIFKEAFEREVVKGHDLKRARRVLRDAGILMPSGKHVLRSERLPGMGRVPVYCLALPDSAGEEDDNVPADAPPGE